jgi:WD40 repeat protein
VPVGDNATSLHLDLAPDHRSGLKFKGNRPLTDPQTPTRTTAFQSNPSKVHALNVRVVRSNFQVTITVHVDDRELFQWQGLPGELDEQGWSMPDKRQFGFGGWTPPRIIHEAKLQMLTGQAILLRRPPAGVKLPSWAVAPQSGSSPATAPKIVLRKKLTGHTKPVQALAFHPDSQLLASGAHWGQLKLWDASSGQQTGEFKGHNRNIGSITFDHEGKRLLSSDSYYTLKVWDVPTQPLVTSMDGNFGAVAVSRDGKSPATCGGEKRGGTLRDPANLAALAPLEDYVPLTTFDFSHNGQRLAAGGNSSRLSIYRTSDGKRFHNAMWNAPHLRVAFSHDDKTLAVGGERISGIRLLDASDLAKALPVRAKLPTALEVRAMAWLPGSRYLVVAMKDLREVQLWDTQELKMVASLTEHTKPILALDVSPDGRTLATAGEDFDVILWDIVTPASELPSTLVVKVTPSVTIDTKRAELRSVAWGLRGAYLAVGSNDGTIGVFDVAKNQSVNTLANPGGKTVNDVAFTPDGYSLWSGGGETVELWNWQQGKSERSLDGNRIWQSPDGTRIARERVEGAHTILSNPDKSAFTQLPGRLAAFSRDSERIAVAESVDTIAIRSAKRGGDPPQKLTSSAGKVAQGLAFSPDGQSLAVAWQEDALELWDLTTGKLRAGPIKSPNNTGTWWVDWSPDGKLIASGGIYDVYVYLRDPRDGSVVQRFNGGVGYVARVAFSPDGKRLAVVGNAKEAQILDIEVSELSAASRLSVEVTQAVAMASKNANLLSVAWSQDDKHLAAGGEEGKIEVFDVAKGTSASSFEQAPKENVHSLVFTPDGNSLWAASGDAANLWKWQTPDSTSNMVTFGRFWISPDGKFIACGHLHSSATALGKSNFSGSIGLQGKVAAFSPDSQRVALAVREGLINVYGTDLTDKVLHAIASDQRDATEMTFSPDGQSLAVAWLVPGIEVWDLASGQRRFGPVKNPNQTSSDRTWWVRWSPDGKLIACGGLYDGNVYLRDARDGSIVKEFNAGVGNVTRVAFNRDGKRLAVVGNAKEVRIFDIVTDPDRVAAQRVISLGGAVRINGDSRGIHDSKDLPNDPFVVTWVDLGSKPATDEGLASLENLRGLETLLLHGTKTTDAGLAHLKNLKSLRFFSLQATQVTGAGLVQLHALQGLKQIDLLGTKVTLAEVEAFHKAVPGCQITHNGGMIFPVAAPALKATLQQTLPESNADWVVVSHDGKLVAARSRGEKLIKQWNLQTDARLKIDTTLDNRFALAYQPDGKTLAAGEEEKVAFFDTAAGKPSTPLAAHGAHVRSIAFNRAGQMATCGSNGDATVKLWDLSALDNKKTVGKHGDPPGAFVMSVAFNPDGNLLASGGNDSKVRIYDVATAKEIKVLDGGYLVQVVAFSPNGKYLATAIATRRRRKTRSALAASSCGIHRRGPSCAKWPITRT